MSHILLLVFVSILSAPGSLLAADLPAGPVLLAAGSAPAQEAAEKKEPQLDRYKNLELFQKVMHFIETNYVDEVKNSDLVQGAIKGMLETLDPHSNFLPPDVFKDMRIDTSGKFGGLGIEITLKDNVLTVATPIEDTPAWKAGLKPNDKIVKINGESTKGLNLVEAVSKMRGKKGSSILLTIYRNGWEKFKDVTLVRDTIKIQSVKNEVLEKGYGYVRLNQFNENAASDMKAAIAKLEKEGGKLKGLVFDLRMNPGGLLDQAVDVSSLFIDEGVVVSTIGRNKNQKEVKYAKPGQARKDFPIAILVNSSSASAAEIVAGALQDHKRAIVMGQPTFGKGSVQTVIELGNQMGLKLTIARYYTPSGRSIQEKGVMPDVILDEYDTKLLAKAKIKRDSTREKDLKGHMTNEEELMNATATDAKKEESDKKEFSKDELDRAGKKDDEDKDDMSPIKFIPKEDYQVKEALNFLRSYEVFKKISTTEASSEAKK